jgi:hypothetical protein
MSTSKQSLDFTFQRLREIRLGVLHLHKALLEFERRLYEQANGPISSNGQFLQLVIGDEWFSWLHSFSQYIVAVDEALSNKEEPMTLQQANEFVAQARSLLKMNEEGTHAEKRYFDAVQREPDITLMHIQIWNLLDG